MMSRRRGPRPRAPGRPCSLRPSCRPARAGRCDILPGPDVFSVREVPNEGFGGSRRRAGAGSIGAPGADRSRVAFGRHRRHRPGGGRGGHDGRGGPGSDGHGDHHRTVLDPSPARAAPGIRRHRWFRCGDGRERRLGCRPHLGPGGPHQRAGRHGRDLARLCPLRAHRCRCDGGAARDGCRLDDGHQLHRR